jgi:antirestriction protein ArdC
VAGLGRQVRKGEKGIVILVPHKRQQADHQDVDEHKRKRQPPSAVFTSVSGFGIGRVFDVLQTDGDPLRTSTTRSR